MPRVLVADDDTVQLDLFRLILESTGHHVATAPSPSEMMRQLDWADVLIMDLQFPDAGMGLALIRKIREMGLPLPVIVLSGWPEELYGRPEETMVFRVMMKPTGAQELLSAVQAAAAAA